MGKKFLTLNIGASEVELAEYEAAGKSLTLVNYGTAALAAPLDSGNASAILSPALLEIVREKGIRPGKVAVSLSGQMVFPRFAAIPMAGGEEKFDQLVRYEIEQNIPFPIDEMVCDRAILGDTEGGDKAVMVVAAKVDQVEAVTDAVASAGFTPELVDVAPVALTNLVKAMGGDADGCAVLLDIGAKTTSLVIVEGEKLYNRSIPVAGNAINKEIAQLLGCSLDEAEQVKRESAYVSMGGVTEDEDETLDRISKACRAVMTRINAEVSRSINFYRSQQGGGTPVRLYLTGGTALLPQADEFFREALGIEVAYLNPFELIGVGGAVDASQLEADGMLLAATAGLALHAAGRAEISINLMPPSLMEARAEVARIPFLAVGAVAFVAAAVCWLVASMGETSRLEELSEEVTQEAARLEGVQQKIDRARADEADAYAAATNLARRISRRCAAVERVRAVKAALEPELWVAKWEETVVKTEVPDPGARGAARTREVEIPVIRVTARGWKDDVAALVDRASTVVGPVAEAPAAGKAEEAETGKAGDAADKDGDEDAAPAPAAEAAERGGRKLTAGMVVVEKLRLSGLFVPESVKIAKGRNLGKDGCLEEFVVEMQCKEPEYK